MACCLFKSCCGCFELQMGSLLIGYILLVLKVIALCLNSQAINEFVEYLNSEEFELEGLILVGLILTVLDEVTLILEIILTILLLVGLYKKKRGFIQAFYILSAIVYVISCILFIIWNVIDSDMSSAHSVEDIVLLSADIFTILITPYFLLVVRSRYHQTDDSSNAGVVYSSVSQPFLERNPNANKVQFVGP